MTIKSRLTLLFTIISGSILMGFALVVFLSASSDRRNEFFNTLKKEAMTRANVLLGAGIDAETLQRIYLEHREIINEVEVAIYKPGFELIYHDAVEIDFVKETPEMIEEIISRGEIRFTQQGWDVIGMLYHFKGEPYILTAAAYDEYGHTKLYNLFRILVVSWLVAVVAIFFAGRFFAWRALQPVSQMVDKAGEIRASHMGLRLNEGNGKDELAELAITFNQMLDRLENSFDAQKEFVSNISHELRTPLSAIIGEIELALSQDRDSGQYRLALESILADARGLSKLSTGLLDLARATYEPGQISLKEVRIDEILLDARNELIKINPEYKINLHFDEELTDDTHLSRNGNEYLLKVAFANIMENACKFSPDMSAQVDVRYSHEKLVVAITDQGAGIPPEELELVFKPFFRGKNSRSVSGTGIGLSLVQKIIHLHKSEISITSEEGKGTIVSIIWP